MDMKLRKIIRDFVNWQRKNDLLKNENTIDYELAETYLEETEEQLSIGFVSKRFWFFDCWDKSGVLQTRQIEALNAENAEIIFKYKYEDLGYDPPY